MAQSDRNVASSGPAPGLLLVFGSGVPRCEVLSLEDGKLVLGRGANGLDDVHLSREHAKLSKAGRQTLVSDSGSRNGTFLNGVQLRETTPLANRDVLRLGETLFVYLDDVRPFWGARTTIADGCVVGPQIRAVMMAVEQATAAGNRLLILGETGAGKELVARAYHRSAAANGPFEALNCAALPASLAESLLFGSIRGAFSGASADRAGHISQAAGGVLFLDEVAELDQQVQAKLLRFLETGEVVPLGSAKAKHVPVQVCAATCQDMLERVHTGAFRADLYHRLAQSVVIVPPLRERQEEVPWLVVNELGKARFKANATGAFVEACMLRPWEGNIRALVAAAREAATRARSEGSDSLKAKHLASPVRVSTPHPTTSATISPETLKEEIAKQGGNLTQVAQSLRLHRTQLYRLLARYGLSRDGATGSNGHTPVDSNSRSSKE